TEAIKLGNQLSFEKYDIRKLHGQIYADNIGSIKAYCKAGWIIEGVIKGRYLKNGHPMDQILVSYNNPKYFNPAGQDTYNIDKLKEWIKIRESFLKK
ncbi:MAG: GNAT family N-acetyltransferase, partial [Bacteroidia bacterium]|nr:GNAT family N-acetyltransferase [Bacteroidia bacterium]